jgi:predicted nucleic acid-binding protein
LALTTLPNSTIIISTELKSVKPPIFLDTGYLLAVLNTRDKYHDRAVAVAATLEPPFLTTEAVLVEVGNALSRLSTRKLGITALRTLRSDSEISLVPVGHNLFERGVELYSTRPDKEWGLTDCISFVVMRDSKLTEVVTTDHHFEQAGFHNLLPVL